LAIHVISVTAKFISEHETNLTNNFTRNKFSKFKYLSKTAWLWFGIWRL